MTSAPRRSTRTRVPNVQVTASELSAEESSIPQQGPSTIPAAQQEQQDDAEDDVEDEDEYEGPSNGKRKRKAPVGKEKSAKSQGKPVKKAKVKKGRGVLQQLLEMPFDILFEIFGHCMPYDLLSLGRTSKDFRQLVLSPEFKSIWIHSRSHVQGLPARPENISEPQYAELAFGKGCLVRLPLLLRYFNVLLCSGVRCIDDIYVTASYISRLGMPAIVTEKVPRTYLRHKQRYSPHYGHKWAEEYKALKTPEEQQQWQSAKIAQSDEAKQHARLCLEWQRSFARMGSYQKMDERKDRKARMVELARSMGWDDELAELVVDDPDIDKICSRKLTDKTLQNARPIIQRIMTEAEERRVLREQGTMFKARMTTLMYTYTDALSRWYSPLKLRPRIPDIFLIPRIKSVVTDTPPQTVVTSAHFNITQETLPSLIEEAYGVIKQTLLLLMDEDLRGESKDQATVLKLASTVFINRQYGYGRTFMTVWQALNPISHQDYYYTANPDSIEAAAHSVFQKNPWNFNQSIAFSRPAHDIVCELLIFLGFDPSTATVDEVNDRDAIIECLDCNNRTTGRLLMRWACAAFHALNSHSVKHMNDYFQLADERDTLRAKAAIKIENEKECYVENVQAKCRHCDDHVSYISNMRKHLLESHDIAYPEDDDMDVAERNGCGGTESCRLWPARPG
ncbi:hypothetical protein CVT24_004980 [Panaeolus cyanescens]|uniref:F-box domain-containing protein n=1 Tax=Panaeolus cyanescens TaxID=181874 RepID=A0A409V9P0_9AGAR|nr:hypothetical protein CVT24_004980 [Panaeolus cyanescens]